jgi:hypothetical protein
VPYLTATAYSQFQNDAFAFTGNTATLVNHTTTVAGIYSERRFLLKELAWYKAAAIFPTPLGNVGTQMSYHGFSAYHQYELALAYARKLGAAMDVGIQFNYGGYRVPVVEQGAQLSASIGAMLHISKQVQAGVQVRNLGLKSPSKSASIVASSFDLGIGYDASEKFFIQTQLLKESNMPMQFAVSVQYQFLPVFFIRGGMVTGSNSIFAGAAIFVRQLRIDITSHYHPQLGITPGIALVFMGNRATPTSAPLNF